MISPLCRGPPLLRMMNPFFALSCRGIEVAATICVPKAVNGQADQLTNTAMDTRESEEWPCLYVNPLALSVFTWLGAFWKRAQGPDTCGTATRCRMPPQAGRIGGGGAGACTQSLHRRPGHCSFPKSTTFICTPPPPAHSPCGEMVSLLL